jgi:hypothetical protein
MSTPKKDNKRLGKPGGSPAPAKAKAGSFSSAVVSIEDEEMSIVTQANAAPLWFVAYEKRIDTKFDNLSTQMESVKTIAESAKQEAQMAMEVAHTTDTAMKQLHTEMSELRKQFKEMSPVAGGYKPVDTGEDSKARELEVIAHGFEVDTDAKEIEEVLNKFIKDMQFEARVDKTYTFSDPSSIGVIRFNTVPSKYGFYKKLREYSAMTQNGKKLDFEDNKTLDERTREKHLGYTKHILMNREMAKPESIKIFWREEYVEVDKVKVAWLNSAGGFEVSGVAEKIKDEVECMVRTFTAKRSGGRATRQ